MAMPASKFYTPEEYLTLEEKADYKSEYYDGEIFAMAGASTNHNRIAGNVFAALHTAFKGKPCEVFSSDVRLLVKPNGLHTYPDVMVVCGQVEFAEERNDIITNPIVIVEVLSASTRDYDRGGKFTLYRDLATLQDYVLVDQAEAHVEHFHKLDDGTWLLREYRGLEGSLRLHALEFEMPMRDIYEKVDWESG